MVPHQYTPSSTVAEVADQVHRLKAEHIKFIPLQKEDENGGDSDYDEKTLPAVPTPALQVITKPLDWWSYEAVHIQPFQQQLREVRHQLTEYHTSQSRRRHESLPVHGDYDSDDNDDKHCDAASGSAAINKRRFNIIIPEHFDRSSQAVRLMHRHNIWLQHSRGRSSMRPSAVPPPQHAWQGTKYWLTLLSSLEYKLTLKIVFSCVRFKHAWMTRARLVSSSYRHRQRLRHLRHCFYSLLLECVVNKSDASFQREFHFGRLRSKLAAMAGRRRRTDATGFFASSTGGWEDEFTTGDEGGGGRAATRRRVQAVLQVMKPHVCR